MLAASAERIDELLRPEDVVLDLGGWAAPFERADWVVDLLPYETRGLYGSSNPERERFDATTWIVRDLCDREPLPFADDEIDFAICSHTLEDLRDPVWVCAELARVAKAGYVEVPSRLEEQSYGVHGPWVGWSHHHWLVDVDSPGARLEFVFKPHVLHGPEQFHFPAGFAERLSAAERVQTLFWEGSFGAAERIFTTPEELDAYLGDFVTASGSGSGPRRGLRRRPRSGRGA
ncbi:MAG TPA: methyltransferase domain-containing protein [Solirubrobacterales bacterium]